MTTRFVLDQVCLDPQACWCFVSVLLPRDCTLPMAGVPGGKWSKQLAWGRIRRKTSGAIQRRLGASRCMLLTPGGHAAAADDWVGLSLARSQAHAGICLLSTYALRRTFTSLPGADVWSSRFDDLGTLRSCKRPYICWSDFTALCGLVPLALTSNQWMMRRLMKRRWRRTCINWVYPVSSCSAAQRMLFWLTRSDYTEPLHVQCRLLCGTDGVSRVLKYWRQRRPKMGRADVASERCK